MDGKTYKITNELHGLLGESIIKANKLKLTFEDVEFQIDLETEFFIDPENIVDAMLTHTTNFGWWSSLKFTAEEKLKQVTLDLHLARGSTTDTAEDRIKNLQRHQQRNSLEQIVNFVNHVLTTYEHRRDILKEINKAQCNQKQNERYN